MASSCSSNVSTKAVNSCGLEISLGAMFLAAGGCFAAPFTLGPDIFGVLFGLGEAGTLRGAGPITNIRDMDMKQFGEKREQKKLVDVGRLAGSWDDGFGIC